MTLCHTFWLSQTKKLALSLQDQVNYPWVLEFDIPMGKSIRFEHQDRNIGYARYFVARAQCELRMCWLALRAKMWSAWDAQFKYQHQTLMIIHSTQLSFSRFVKRVDHKTLHFAQQILARCMLHCRSWTGRVFSNCYASSIKSRYEMVSNSVPNRQSYRMRSRLRLNHVHIQNWVQMTCEHLMQQKEIN